MQCCGSMCFRLWCVYWVLCSITIITSRFLIRHKPAWLNGYLEAPVLHTCNRSTILLAKGGVNCHTCWSERPSMSNMTTAPATCVSGSSMAISRNSTQPLYTSSRETLLCFHFSAHTHTHTHNNDTASTITYISVAFSQQDMSCWWPWDFGREGARKGEKYFESNCTNLCVTATCFLFLLYF